ncbi:MAG: ABC transporter permease [Lachnospiraceae bacterium]|nr:ABC transporter permease [Lachnospiraceae bacterium]
MKMITRLSLANMKYHKSKNILIGIAVFLTALLLFLVPTIGKNMIDGQFAVINEVYPRWHALYRGVDEETAAKLAAHHAFGMTGLRSDAGYMVHGEAEIALVFLDEPGLELYNITLASGKLPEQENEIVVSEGILRELGQSGETGDMISVPYQIYRNGGLDYREEREFVISGFLADGEEASETRAYTALVSKAFLEEEIPKDQRGYRFLFQLRDLEAATTDRLEEQILSVAEQFGLGEQNISVNNDYLSANYVDPAFAAGIVIIMLIIVAAGIITIYSIYYVSMGDRVQEYGRLKAIGATRRQIKQLVLREGFAVAGIAIPLGLLVGTVLSRMLFVGFIIGGSEDNLMLELLKEGRFASWYWWIYVLTAVVALGTVYISLRKPMRLAAKISEIEAIRYRNESAGKKKHRKGVRNVTISSLTGIYLAGDKKKSLMTICSMAATGIFLIVTATVLSCTTPRESADSSMYGQYVIMPLIEYNNKEHPEREWSSIQQNNPMTEELRKEIGQIDGVEYVISFSRINSFVEELGGSEGILGVPVECREELLKEITKGSVTYEELCTGNKVIADTDLLYWYPEIELGDRFHITLEDGDETKELEVEIAAFGDYSFGFTNYNYLLMAKEAVDSLGSHNLTYSYHIFAKEDYNEDVAGKLKELVTASELLQFATWQEEYEMWKSALGLTNGCCYAFLGVLGTICIMNMINTMINSVHVRKKEIGVLQAIGMSDRQLTKMLQLEGLFYTMGTLALSIGVGSLLSYPVFLLAKKNGMFGIRNYHYPTEAVVVLCVVLLVIQMVLAWLLGKSVKKEALIERIRFSE